MIQIKKKKKKIIKKQRKKVIYLSIIFKIKQTIKLQKYNKKILNVQKMYLKYKKIFKI